MLRLLKIESATAALVKSQIRNGIGAWSDAFLVRQLFLAVAIRSDSEVVQVYYLRGNKREHGKRKGRERKLSKRIKDEASSSAAFLLLFESPDGRDPRWGAYTPTLFSSLRGARRVYTRLMLKAARNTNCKPGTSHSWKTESKRRRRQRI